jgi:hypothetical protein
LPNEHLAHLDNIMDEIHHLHIDLAMNVNS